MTRSSLRSTLVTVAVLLGAAAAVLVARGLAPHPAVAGLGQSAIERSLGDPGARLWIVEYLDYQCAACREASEYLESVVEQRPGEIYLQVRSFPMRAHEHALEAAISAECAARQKRFWPYHRLLLSRQEVWSRLEKPSGLWASYAAEAGLRADRFKACLEDESARRTVLQERDDAAALGVEGTPTIYVGGEPVIGAALLPQAVEAALDKNSRETSS
ncbi:MAG: hypothetical protein MOGMAGMI_00051 [Candidatus Omnitrophica bacterium]|nr:hypothetical protein [Candidatus Omnitrophota bacterium]